MVLATTQLLLVMSTKTAPLSAAPHENLDFSHCQTTQKAEPFSLKLRICQKKRKFKERIRELREKECKRSCRYLKQLVNPVASLDDDVYFEGLKWVERLMGKWGYDQAPDDCV